MRGESRDLCYYVNISEGLPLPRMLTFSLLPYVYSSDTYLAVCIIIYTYSCITMLHRTRVCVCGGGGGKIYYTHGTGSCLHFQ